MDHFSVDITPSVTTYELYQIASYTHWFSIGEFIDNSITSALQNWDKLKEKDPKFKELIIDIDLDSANGILTIRDNAAGIQKSEIQRALRAGEPPADRTKLSVHGVGMKMSAFWWGRNLKIETYPVDDSKGYSVEVDLDQIKSTRSAVVEVSETPGKSIPGTLVTVSRIPHEKIPRGSGLGKLKLLLTSMYRIYLNSTETPVRIMFNGQPLVFTPLPILKEPFWPDKEGPIDDQVVEWIRVFVFTTSRGNVIRGVIGLLEKMSRDLSGLFLHYKGKGMGGIGSSSAGTEFSQQDVRDGREYYRPGRIFGQEGTYRWQRFTGEFDISALGKTSSTDAIKWDSDEEQEFLEALEEFLKEPKFNMWAMAENFQSRKAIQLKKGENENSTEFTLDEVQSIADYLSTKIHGEAIKHNSENESEAPTVGPRSLTLVPDEKFVASEKSFVVPDSSGHSHAFFTQFINDPNFDLFLIESQTDDSHILKVNVGHPFIRRMQWGNEYVREAVINLIFLMAVPEVFLQTRCSRWAFREKINEVVDATLNRDASL
jgi:hypothetical protein